MTDPDPLALVEEAEPIRAFEIHICEDCLSLRGEMCHRPGCIFCRRTMSEVGDCLDMLLIRPVIDGVRIVVDDGVLLVEQRRLRPCQWAVDDLGGDSVYETQCGHAFQFNEDGPAENGFKFCGYCGGQIVEARTSDDRGTDA